MKKIKVKDKSERYKSIRVWKESKQRMDIKFVVRSGFPSLIELMDAISKVSTKKLKDLLK